MRQIDNMTPQEIDTLALKGMTAPNKANLVGSPHESPDTTGRQAQWTDQALNAIRQGQDLNEFILHCHPDSRREARKVYMRLIVRAVNHADKLAGVVRKLRQSIRHAHNCKAPQAFPCSCDADALWTESAEALTAYEAAQ